MKKIGCMFFKVYSFTCLLNQKAFINIFYYENFSDIRYKKEKNDNFYIK